MLAHPAGLPNEPINLLATAISIAQVTCDALGCRTWRCGSLRGTAHGEPGTAALCEIASAAPLRPRVRNSLPATTSARRPLRGMLRAEGPKASVVGTRNRRGISDDIRPLRERTMKDRGLTAVLFDANVTTTRSLADAPAVCATTSEV